MFSGVAAGGRINTFILTLPSKFNTINVTNMEHMFHYDGYFANNFNLDLGSNFDTSNVTTMNFMFYLTGARANNFSINLGSKYNTSKVTNMNTAFRGLGGSSTKKYTLNLAAGNFANVTIYSDMLYHFNTSVGNIYVKDATARSWIINKNSTWGTNFNTSTVLIK